MNRFTWPLIRQDMHLLKRLFLYTVPEKQEKKRGLPGNKKVIRRFLYIPIHILNHFNQNCKHKAHLLPVKMIILV